jgi:hypothetical protein
MKRIAVPLAALGLVLAFAFTAYPQARPGRPAAESAAQKAPEPVDLRESFSLATSSERWTIEDPMPSNDVAFATRRISLEERKASPSDTSDGMKQLLFPVSWFEAYQGQETDIKYVVVKYKDGKACSIMAEYLPERMSLPKESFEKHPDGRTFYQNAAVVRQNGQVYLKQLISQGREDGKGGLWIDMVFIYCTPDKTAPPAGKPGSGAGNRRSGA